MVRRRRAVVGIVLAALSFSCDGRPADTASAPIEPRCTIPAGPVTVREEGTAALLEWSFPDDDVYSDFVLPADSAYLAYRAAIRADGAAVRNPVVDQPNPRTAAESSLARDERFNRDLAQQGEVGIIEPIRCLDALLFAYQHSQVSQLAQPTEFLASVLRKDVAGQTHLTVIFGAGDEMFPPKAVYGFDVAEEYVTRGWQYWYVLHNHTIQRNGDLLALGSPALSTSDVQLMRSLATDARLQSARVTNGFYTFTAAANELDRLRSR